MTDPEDIGHFSALCKQNRARVYAYAVSKAGRQLADEIVERGVPGRVQAVRRASRPTGALAARRAEERGFVRLHHARRRLRRAVAALAEEWPQAVPDQFASGREWSRQRSPRWRRADWPEASDFLGAAEFSAGLGRRGEPGAIRRQALQGATGLMRTSHHGRHRHAPYSQAMLVSLDGLSFPLRS